MRTVIVMVLGFLLAASNYTYGQGAISTAINPYAIVVHGGAGGIRKSTMSPEKEAHFKATLVKAREAGEVILKKGGSAVDAVQAAIMIMENDTFFNAGRGSVLNSEGYVEMDASIMDGSDKNSGAVAGVTNIKNPILAARYVMDKSVHVMFAAKGAEKFAEEKGCETADKNYFITKKNKDLYENVKKRRENKSQLKDPINYDEKYGTVGCVALDKNGNIAAGTSTGGMTNKQVGRVGDSPIIGAGTYADNTSAGVSCTGQGEYYIRLGFAKALCDRILLQGSTLKDATSHMIHGELKDMGGKGGVIAIDKHANIAIDFNTVGMHRAWMSSIGDSGVELYSDKDDSEEEEE